MKNLTITSYFYLSFSHQFVKEIIDYISHRKSYSQYGEDLIVNKLVKKYAINKESIYIDICANHPTRLSNTFVFYKKVFHRILIEPIKNFAFLYKLFRKKVIILKIGIGK